MERRFFYKCFWLTMQLQLHCFLYGTSHFPRANAQSHPVWSHAPCVAHTTCGFMVCINELLQRADDLAPGLPVRRAVFLRKSEVLIDAPWMHNKNSPGSLCACDDVRFNTTMNGVIMWLPTSSRRCWHQNRKCHRLHVYCMLVRGTYGIYDCLSTYVWDIARNRVCTI